MNLAKHPSRSRSSLLGLGLVLPTLVTWVYFELLSTYAAWLQQTAYTIGKSAQFVLPLIVWWLWIRLTNPTEFRTTDPALQRRESANDLAQKLAAPRYRESLLLGFVSGLLIAVAILATMQFVMMPLGWLDGPRAAAQQKLQEMGLNSVAVFLGVAIFYSLCHSGLEEYYWRWFIFREARLRMSLWPAVLVSSLGFMAHLIIVLARYFGWSSPLTYLLASGVAVGGAIWALMYHRTRSIYGSWISHAFVDAAVFYVAYRLGFGDG